MRKTFEAVFEQGVLRPLAPLGLADHQQITVTIEVPASAEDPAAFFDPADWEAAQHDQISLAEVRSATAGIRGSLADAVIAGRSER